MGLWKGQEPGSSGAPKCFKYLDSLYGTVYDPDSTYMSLASMSLRTTPHTPRRTDWPQFGLMEHLCALNQPARDVPGKSDSWRRSYFNIPPNKAIFSNNHEIQLIIIIIK